MPDPATKSTSATLAGHSSPDLADSAGLLPPPTLLEVLTAYSTSPSKDRSALLSLLAAKHAEDERLARAWNEREDAVRRAAEAASASLGGARRRAAAQPQVLNPPAAASERSAFAFAAEENRGRMGSISEGRDGTRRASTTSSTSAHLIDPPPIHLSPASPARPLSHSAAINTSPFSPPPAHDGQLVATPDSTRVRELPLPPPAALFNSQWSLSAAANDRHLSAERDPEPLAGEAHRGSLPSLPSFASLEISASPTSHPPWPLPVVSNSHSSDAPRRETDGRP